MIFGNTFAGHRVYNLRMTTVADLMPLLADSVASDVSLGDAVALMVRSRNSAVVVLEHDVVVGILTQRDVLLAMCRHDNQQRRIREFMTSPVLTVCRDMEIREAFRFAVRHGIRHLVVTNHAGALLGIISETDFRRHFGLDYYRQMSTVDGLMERVFPRLSPDLGLDAAVAAMESARATCVVVTEQGRPIGILTERDIVRLFLNGVSDVSLASVMTQPLCSVSPDTPVAEAATLMLESCIRHLTVVDAQGRLVGLLSEHCLVRPFELDLLDDVIDERVLLSGQRQLADEALLIRNAALAAMLRGERLENALELIVLSVEREVPDLKCAIMLPDETGHCLRLGAAPGLSEEVRQAIDGIAIAENSGVSGTAAYRCGEAFIENILADSVGELARNAGIAAGWASALLDPSGVLLGTFSGYRKQPGRMPVAQREVIRQAGQIAALVLAYHRQSTQVAASQATFRGIFDAVSDALFVLDGKGRFLDSNKAGEQLSGYTHAQLTSHSHESIAAIGLNDLDAVRASIDAAMAGQAQTIEFWGTNAAGQIVLVRGQLSQTSYFGRPAVLALASDITAQRSEQYRLEIERDLAAALSAGVERQSMLETILDVALRFPEFDVGGIYWLDDTGGYRLIAQRGLSEAFAKVVHYFGPETEQAQRVRNGETLCSCTQLSPRCGEDFFLEQPLVKAEGFRCLLVQPIRVAGRPLACLNLAGYRSLQISSATYYSLRNLASHCAQTLERLAAQEQAQHLQENLSGLFDSLNDFIFILDLQGRILHHNQSVSDRLGYADGALLGQSISAVHPPEMQKTVLDFVAEIIAGLRSTCPLPLLRADASTLMVETRVVTGHWNGQPALFAVSQDITERLQAENRQRLAASVFDNAHEGIMITDPKGVIIEVNSTFTELTGYTYEEAVGCNADLLKSGHHDDEFYNEMWAAIRQLGHWHGEVWNRKKSGEIFVELLTISAVRDVGGVVSQYVAIFSDITALKEHQQRLEHLAHFDALTQLPNRMLLADRLQLSMAGAVRNHALLAVCYLDLDGFKPVNDQYGHSAGDRLLIEVAQRLKLCVRGGDTVARLGGDEFVLLLSGLSDVRECDQALSRILSSLSRPFDIVGQKVHISASVGVTLYPNDGSDADALLRHADQEMYVAKQAGRNRYHLFDPESDRRTCRRREDLARVRKALVAGEFRLYYQPKVDMRQGRVVGAEALIRWQHPERGLLMPGEFLPVIEGSELAIDLGNWVIRTALGQLDAWGREGVHLVVSINIAGEHLQHPGFAESLRVHLAAYPEVAPEYLELEVLETAAIEDIARAATLFEECRRLGVSFALDDFGTGYSSLTYFRRLPAEMLKIDQSFVRDMLDDPEDLAIVEGVIGLTRAFRRKVIAEGVETVEHGLVLLLLGCDLAQGYGIAHPMPADALPGWMRAFQPDELWAAASAFPWSREDLPMLIAEVDHKRWMKTLENYLANPDESTLPPELDDHACGFGRWCYGSGRQRYGSMPVFCAIDDAHQELHRVARQMLELQRLGQVETVAEMWPEVRAVSRAMSDLLQQLQAEILISAQTSKR